VFGKKFGVKLGKQNIGFSEEELVLLFPLFSLYPFISLSFKKKFF